MGARIVQECGQRMCNRVKLQRINGVADLQRGPLTLIVLSSYCRMAVVLLMLNTAFKKNKETTEIENTGEMYGLR